MENKKNMWQLFLLFLFNPLVISEPICTLDGLSALLQSVLFEVEAPYNTALVNARMVAQFLQFQDNHNTHLNLTLVPTLTNCNDGSGQIYDPNPERTVETIIVNATGVSTLIPLSLLQRFQHFYSGLTYLLPSILNSNSEAVASYFVSNPDITPNPISYYYPLADPVHGLCGALPNNFLVQLAAVNLFNIAPNEFSQYSNSGKWSLPYPDLLGQPNMVTLQMPVQDAYGNWMGVFCFDIPLTAARNILSSTVSTTNGDIWIIDALGYLIYASQRVIQFLFGFNQTLISVTGSQPGSVPISLNTTKSEFSELTKLIQSPRGTTKFYALDNNQYYVVWSTFTIASLGWSVIATVPVIEISNAAIWTLTTESGDDIAILSNFQNSEPRSITLFLNNTGILFAAWYSTTSSPFIKINPSSGILDNGTFVLLTVNFDFSNTSVLSSFSQSIEINGLGACFRDLQFTFQIVYKIAYFNYILPTSLKLAVIILASITSIIITVIVLIVWFNRSHSTIVRKSSPLFGIIILISSGIVAISSVLFVIPVSEGVCIMRMWILSLPLYLLLGSLVAKTHRIVAIFSQTKFKIVTLTGTKLSIAIGILFIISLIINLSFSLHNNSGIVTTLIINSQYQVLQCVFDTGFFTTHVILLGSLTIYCAVLAWRVRNVPEDFNEAFNIMVTVTFIACYCSVLLPTQFLISTDPLGVAALRSLGILVGVWFVVGALFGSKLIRMWFGIAHEHKVETILSNKPSVAHPESSLDPVRSFLN